MKSVRMLKGSASAAAIASLLAIAAPSFAQEAPVEAWGVEQTDVEPDPSITYGRLPNGMKYAIRQNDTPEGAASFRLHFEFGSLYEAEDERGLAHFIEHMVFNGSTNVPEGEMVALLERQGLAFGADTNAYTSFDETVYQLDAPNATDEAVDTAMFLLREAAGNATFAPEAVDREREIITSERRQRDNVALRALIDRLEFQLPESLYDDRLPIGLDTVLREAPAERLKSLYHRYYRPENATLVVVGDFDVAAMETRIVDTFGDWEGVGEAGGKPDIGRVDLERAAAFSVFTDPASSSNVVIAVARPYTDPADTLAERRNETLESLATSIMNRRLERLANSEGSPLLGGGVVTEAFDPVTELTMLSIGTGDGQWAEGLAIAENELRRALQYGFTASELQEAIANTEASYRRGAEQADARRTRALADAIVNVAGENDFVTDPAWRYQLFGAMKETLTLPAVNEAFQNLWTGSAPLVTINAKSVEGGEEAVAAAFANAATVAVEAPADAAVATFAYDSFGDGPGDVVADTVIEDLGIRTVTFANNVKLNIKQTDFEPGRVRFNVAMSGGQFALGDAGPGEALLLQLVAAQAGTAAHSFDDIQQVTVGRQVTPGFAAGTDDFVVNGATTPADLALQMKVAAAYLTDPGFRPEAQSRYTSFIGAVYAQLTSQPPLVFQFESSGVLTDDPRFAFPSQEELQAVSLEAIRAPFTANAADAPIEIAVVGDMDADAVIAAVAQSFGALPTRADVTPDYSEQREVAYNDLSGDEVATFTHGGPADQAMAGSVWRTADDGDFREEVTMRLLKEVIDIYATETLREELAATYSPLVDNSMSSDFEDTGQLSVAAVVSPDAVDQVQALIPTLAARLRSEAVSDDMLLRARQPLLERVRQRRKDNGFWLGVASSAQGEPDRLDRAREEEAILQSITAADIMALANKYLVPERRADIRVLPAAAAAE